MSEAYSEISNFASTSAVPQTSNESIASRPNSLQCENKKPYPYNLVGTVSMDGNMTHFVADNLEYEIKISSPISKKESGADMSSSRDSTPSGVQANYRGAAVNVGRGEFDIVNAIENEAHYLAASVDNLTENLCNLLHSISSISADNVETYKTAVNKLTDCMDANIKSMYTILAKSEEISNAMKPAANVSNKIKELKRLVDMLENNL